MKKILQINVTKTGSTGSIMRDIDNLASEEYETKYLYGRGKDKSFLNKIDVYISVLFSRIFSQNNSVCFYNTFEIIKKIKKYKPNLIHIHNIHGYYINISILFKFLKKLNIPIVWTIHDCSNYTGHCAYYTKVNCDKWKKCCFNCPQIKEYPKNLFFDTSKKEYLKKKRLFTAFNNMSLVVPSNWLKQEVKNSFLKEYNVDVIHNAIDTNVFKPIMDESLREKYNLGNSKIILGVANIWDDRKGLNYFLLLSKIIAKDTKILLVGLTKKQINNLPNNIIGIERTENVEELVKIYSLADVFFNPSLEETFSMVTLEAQACGTPCVVFNSTATPELITKETGVAVSDYKIEKIYEQIKIWISKDCKEACVKRASNYQKQNYIKYVELYKKLLGD